MVPARAILAIVVQSTERNDDHDPQEDHRRRSGKILAQTNLREVHGAKDDQNRDQRQSDNAIRHPHEDVVEPPPDVAGDHTDRDPDDSRDEGCQKADGNRHLPAIEQPQEDIPAEIVGAEPMLGGWRPEPPQQAGRVGIEAHQVFDRSSHRTGRSQK